MILPVLVFLAAFAGACSSPSGPDRVALDRPFELRVGEAVVVFPDGVRISFQEVRNDSRCPIDVQCVWAGDAEVVLQVETSPEDREEVTLHTDGSSQTTADVLGHRIELRRLMPENKAGVPIDPKAYVATLLVARLER
jgi:hypothetical protein